LDGNPYSTKLPAVSNAEPPVRSMEALLLGPSLMFEALKPLEIIFWAALAAAVGCRVFPSMNTFQAPFCDTAKNPDVAKVLKFSMSPAMLSRILTFETSPKKLMAFW
jgi:hypothetical protein